MDTSRAEIASRHEDASFGWTQEEVAHLCAGRFCDVARDDIAEKIEPFGRSQLAALTSAYRPIAMHLLKIIAQPSSRLIGTP